MVSKRKKGKRWIQKFWTFYSALDVGKRESNTTTVL
jgi:hypothetical protein